MLIAESCNKNVLACFDICLDTEQEENKKRKIKSLTLIPSPSEREVKHEKKFDIIFLLFNIRPLFNYKQF
jgi:hypothetical protein